VHEVVITGLGIVCPLGIGRDTVWSAIKDRQSGVKTIARLQESGFPITIGGEVPDFEPKQYVRPRKSLKIMSRETQLAFTAAELAWEDAGLTEEAVDPERLGVVLGANVFRSELEELVGLYRETQSEGRFDCNRWNTGMKELYPLWMLKYLPNMAACHVGIARDARGPNNTIVEGDVSSLLAIIEATDTIARGHAEVMLAGATGSQLAWVDVCWHAGARLSQRVDTPAGACRPFDSQRDGMVMSEGSAVLVLESLSHAQRRGAKVWGHILGYGRHSEAASVSKRPTGKAIYQAIETALAMGNVPAQEIGCVHANGVATREDDTIEAQAIESLLRDVPVTAAKSAMGNPGASAGAIELAISLLAQQQGVIPPTLNYSTPDPACPVNVVTDLEPLRSPAILKLNHKLTGQAVSLLVSGS